MFKNQLQELAQRSCFNLPSYSCIREGPDHAPRFKATVNFNGEAFESPTYFSTLRQAEHAAAEVALNTLADRGPSKTLAAKVLDETGVYKNLLQETAHRAGLKLPVYTTVRSGPGHVPIFVCTVDLAAMSFTGEPAKTKKQAQKNAAMVAWSSLKQMSQHGSSSSLTSSGGNEEQEQVIVARYLASLNPAESSKSSQNPSESSNPSQNPEESNNSSQKPAELTNSSQKNKKKGHHRPPASPSRRNSYPSTPTSYGTRYQNWASTNLSPEILASHHMWLQEQQRRLLGLPISAPRQVVPWMHHMLQPSNHPYCLTGNQQPVPLPPRISINSPFYFSNHVVPQPTIQEIQEEKPEESSNLLSPSLPSKAVGPSNRSSELLSNEKLINEAQQDGLPQVKIITSASSETQEKVSPVFNHATSTNYDGILSTASQGVPVGPNHRNFRTAISAPRMQSGVGSFPVSGFGRTQDVGLGFRPPSMAPAVQIRSIVPVCSAAPPRRSTSSTQGESSDGTKSRNSSDGSDVSSKLRDLQI